MKVCMLVYNCKPDTRVLREAKTLTDAGYDVRIIALLDEETEPYEEKDGFRIIRITRDPIHHRAFRAISRAESFAIGLILQLPVWAYHRTERRFTLSSSQIEQPSTSALPGAEQPYTSAPAKTEPLIRRAFFRVRQSYRWVRRCFSWVLRTAIRPLDRPLTYWDYYSRSWQAIRDEPADVYHSHDLNTLPIGYIAKRRAGGKLVYDSHELFTMPYYIPRVERPALRLLVRYLIHRADAVITVNEFVAREMSGRYGIGLPVVVRNCPPLAKQGDEQCGSSLRKSVGLDDTVPIIVHVGIFSRSRGSEKLVSAVPFLNHGVIVFLGWSKEKAELKGLAGRMGVRDRVLFATPVEPEQVVGHISSTQVGVIPFLNINLNHYYATPNKLWECMNAGLPIVASNFPALKAIVEGYHLGCTCDPEYPRDIANAINYVLADKGRYEEMRRNVLEAARIFNWEDESKKLLEVYVRFGRPADDRIALRAGT